jgi:hypothetical protein
MSCPVCPRPPPKPFVGLRPGSCGPAIGNTRTGTGSSTAPISVMPCHTERQRNERRDRDAQDCRTPANDGFQCRGRRRPTRSTPIPTWWLSDLLPHGRTAQPRPNCAAIRKTSHARSIAIVAGSPVVVGSIATGASRGDPQQRLKHCQHGADRADAHASGRWGHLDSSLLTRFGRGLPRKRRRRAGQAGIGLSARACRRAQRPRRLSRRRARMPRVRAARARRSPGAAALARPTRATPSSPGPLRRPSR